nr:S46 family peptidase [Bacteroidota bacterium]
EHDYLTDGFWALDKKEELPSENIYARFLVRIEDVTERVLAEVDDEMTEEERGDKIGDINKIITDEAKDGNDYTATVRSFYGGNEYYLFVYEVFKDVRLVGAPPQSIGKYGADTDNWMWPRHTGDFSIFRVYTATDGSPAEFAEDNVPLKSKYYLPISVAGVDRGDFAMILGYPGGTDRYLSSWGVDLAIEESNPTVVKIRDKKLKIMRQYMDADDEVRIKYSSKYARTSNYWKYFIGQTKGLKRLKVSDKKKAQEAKFNDWVIADLNRTKTYGEALDLLETGIVEQKNYNLTYIYLREAILRGSEILGFARRFGDLEEMLRKKDVDKDALDDEIEALHERAENYFKNYYEPVDKELLGAMLEMFYKNVPIDQQPAYLAELEKKYKGNFVAYADMLFKKSIFTSEEKVDAFLNKPSAKKIAKDPAMKLVMAFVETFPPIQAALQEAYAKTGKGERLYIAGLRLMEPDKKFYPDANSTMRFTYGQVLDYYPADAMHYDYVTHLYGVMEKEDPSNWEFVVPEKLKELYKEKDYGMYGEDGKMVVCFLTNNDITGGNSGSPVLNGWGELIGLAFDGNWEAMSGDIAFEPELQRTICVDIRYVLFIIDKYAGAQNIIDELTIVKSHPKLKDDVESVKQETEIMMGVEE